MRRSLRLFAGALALGLATAGMVQADQLNNNLTLSSDPTGTIAANDNGVNYEVLLVPVNGTAEVKIRLMDNTNVGTCQGTSGTVSAATPLIVEIYPGLTSTPLRDALRTILGRPAITRAEGTLADPFATSSPTQLTFTGCGVEQTLTITGGPVVDKATIFNFRSTASSSVPCLTGSTCALGGRFVAVTVPAPPDCTTCQKDGEAVVEVVVDENVTADLNPDVPTCDDGATADLCDYFSWDKTSADPAGWKAIFDVGGKRLVIGDNSTVTVAPVGAPGGNNLKSPGIVIKGTCELVVQGDIDVNGQPGAVVVKATNQPAGDILIEIKGNTTINGLVRNEVVGTNGRPGEITIASCCGDVAIGAAGRVESIGVGQGGNDINLLTCCLRGYEGDGGDIVINGLVRAQHKYGATPTINIAAFVGAVTIDGRTNLGEEVVAGTAYRRTSGVYVQTVNATSAGDINIQAMNNVTVYGNTILNRNRLQFGAVAVKANNTNGQGGDGDIRVVSTNGGIRAIDRAFDFDGRFNGLNAITLSAKNNIALAVSASINDGALDNSKAVVSSQGGLSGMGGTNTLGAETGQIIVGANALVRANAPGGTDGTNVLAGCAAPGVIRTGTVAPPDVPEDDTSCPQLTPLFTSCQLDFQVFLEENPT